MAFNLVTRDEYALFLPLLFLTHTLHKSAVSVTSSLCSLSTEPREVINCTITRPIIRVSSNTHCKFLDSSPLIYIHPGCLPPQYKLSLAGFRSVLRAVICRSADSRLPYRHVRIFSLLFSYAVLYTKSTSDVAVDVDTLRTIGAISSLDPSGSLPSPEMTAASLRTHFSDCKLC